MKTTNRLSKVLASAGVASRRKAEEMIFAGLVTVNGEKVFKPETQVSLKKDVVCVKNKQIESSERKVYYILNKPSGYICSSSRVGNKKIVTDIFKGLPERVFTIGRLDRETTGLLLVTNDGHFANQVIHPRANIQKEYLIKTSEEINHEHLERMARGTRVEGVCVKPVRVTKVRKGTAKIVVKEGKKREVRTIVEAAGLKLLSLQRTRIGGLRLGQIPLGVFRELTDNEKKTLFS